MQSEDRPRHYIIYSGGTCPCADRVHGKRKAGKTPPSRRPILTDRSNLRTSAVLSFPIIGANYITQHPALSSIFPALFPIFAVFPTNIGLPFSCPSIECHLGTLRCRDKHRHRGMRSVHPAGRLRHWQVVRRWGGTPVELVGTKSRDPGCPGPLLDQLERPAALTTSSGL